MSEESKADQTTKPVDSEMLKYMKIAHDRHATVVHLFKTRVQFFFEEFLGIQELVAFYEALRDDLLKKIQEIEPAPVSEPKKPYVIDVPEKQAEQLQ
jgi:hypothetical protein